MTDPDRDFLREHLEEVPIFRALLRSVECRLIAEACLLPRPVVDLGCGDGDFASHFDEGENWIGMDLDRTAIGGARRRFGSRRLVLADSGALPFPYESVGTVLANSVLEHIPDLERTLTEVHRVLRPGGTFLITAPSDHFAEMLFFSSLFNRVGLRGLGRVYGDWFNGHSLHHHTDSIPVWTDRLERFGFECRAAWTYFPARSHRLFDLLHYLSLPRWISKKVFGRWVLFPKLSTNRLLHSWLTPHVDARPANPGAYLFIRASNGPPSAPGAERK